MGAMARNPLPALLALAALLLNGAAGAQSPAPEGDQTYDESDQPIGDPPDRAARLAYLSGEVSMQPAGEQEWAPAMLNRPLTTDDRLWTERGGRVEIQVGQTAVRLDGQTGFSFLNLDDDTLQMRVTSGTIIVDVRELAGREHIEIDTPNVALSLLREGSYRVEVNDAGDVTTVKIGDGEAEANGPSQNVIVRSRQVVTFRGFDNLVADWSSLGAPDAFDDWSMERERRFERLASSPASRYVSPEVTGYDELDDHGSWSSEPEYGYVWTPRNVAVDWSPYRYGRWVWVTPWGWTWIDDAPWGYAPFHYGRWAHIRHRWCWVPGPRHVRAVYAPALVGWHGRHGTHVSWYPLGPRDVYVPGRRFSRHYMERVNFANTLIISRVHVRDAYERRGPRSDFRDRFVSGAVTAATRQAFTSGQRIGDRRARLDEREWRNGNDGSPPRLSPHRDSRMGGNVRARPRVPAALVDRQVVVRRDPPAASTRFTRRPVTPVEQTQSPTVAGRNVHPRERAAFERERRNDSEALTRQRPDRPPRADRPVSETDPRTQSSVFDSRAIAERVREDRERQVRDAQQRRDQADQHRESLRQRRDVDEQQREVARQRSREWNTQRETQAETQREQQQDSMRAWRERQQQDRNREGGQRQQDSNRFEVLRQAAERQQQQREQRQEQRQRVEQPRVERQREERVRTDSPRVERAPPQQQPREDRAPRSQPPPENRAPRGGNEHPRAKRN
jgi:hypothetical protein